LQRILSKISVLYRRNAPSVTGVRGIHGPRSAWVGVANTIAVGTRGLPSNVTSAPAQNAETITIIIIIATRTTIPCVCCVRTPRARRNCNADTPCVHCTRRVYCVQRYARVAQRRPSLSSTWRLDAGDSRTRTHPSDFERVNDTAAAAAMIATAAAWAPPLPHRPFDRCNIAAPWTRDYYNV